MAVLCGAVWGCVGLCGAVYRWTPHKTMELGYNHCREQAEESTWYHIHLVLVPRNAVRLGPIHDDRLLPSGRAVTQWPTADVM